MLDNADRFYNWAQQRVKEHTYENLMMYPKVIGDGQSMEALAMATVAMSLLYMDAAFYLLDKTVESRQNGRGEVNKKKVQFTLNQARAFTIRRLDESEKVLWKEEA